MLTDQAVNLVDTGAQLRVFRIVLPAHHHGLMTMSLRDLPMNVLR